MGGGFKKMYKFIQITKHYEVDVICFITVTSGMLIEFLLPPLSGKTGGRAIDPATSIKKKWV